MERISPVRPGTYLLRVALVLLVAVGAAGLGVRQPAHVGANHGSFFHWTDRAPIPTPRYYMGTAVVDGLLYTVGGTQNYPIASGVVEVYNPATNTWSARAPMLTPRVSPTVFAAGGKIYAIGGAATGTDSLATVEVYDPATDSWAARPNAPSTTYGMAAAQALDGSIYLFGGYPGCCHYYLPTVYRFDHLTGTFVPRANMPLGVQGALAITGDDGKVYLFGGNGSPAINFRQVYVYDPVANSWSIRPQMPLPVTYASGVKGPDGRMYIFNARDASGAPVVLRYDPVSGTWEVDNSAPRLAAGQVAAAITPNEVYLLGGADLSTPWPYQPIGDLRVSPFPGTDGAPPDLEFSATPPPNAHGWNNTDVTISWTCTDADSGVDEDLSDLAPDALTESGTAAATCVDLAGNSTAATHDVLIDKTPPVFGLTLSHNVSVPAGQPWTDTGIDIPAGAQVDITASGRIRIAYSDPGKYPDGRTYDSETPGTVCNGPNWVIETAGCWSLTGRIGPGGAGFAVGMGTSFVSTEAGRLYLGVNDDVFGDNTGAWSASVTISLDGVSASPPPNANGWNNSDVVVSWVCTDAESGVDEDLSDLAPDTLTASGTASATCFDRGDNSTTATHDVLIDKSDPTLTPQPAPLPNANGWNNSDVVVSWVCGDADSGEDEDLSDLSPDTLTASGTASATCVDLAGNSTAATHDILIDKVAPVVTIAAPVDGVIYGLGSILAPSFACEDAGGSGIVSCTASSISTAAVGTFVFFVTAVDAAGNSTTASVSYAVGGKNECKDGGWQQYINPSFSNQGQCVAYFASQP